MNYQVIESFLDKIELYYAKMIEQGYCLSQMNVDQIESMRQRLPWERSYLYYHKERQKEALYQAKPCLVEKREDVPLEKRSPYIEQLAAYIKEVGLSDTQQKFARLSLDINYLTYIVWYKKYSVPDKSGLTYEQWGKERHRPQVEQEVQIAVAKMAEFPPLTNGFASVVTLLTQLAESYGFIIKKAQSGLRPWVVIECPLTEELSIYVEWEDHYLYKSQQCVELRFVLQHPQEKLWKRGSRDVVSYGMSNLLPGANYDSLSDSLDKAALSIVAHYDFMKVVRECYAKNP